MKILLLTITIAIAACNHNQMIDKLDTNAEFKLYELQNFEMNSEDSIINTFTLSNEEKVALIDQLKDTANFIDVIKRCKHEPNYKIEVDSTTIAYLNIDDCPYVEFKTKGKKRNFKDLKEDAPIIGVLNKILKK